LHSSPVRIGGSSLLVTAARTGAPFTAGVRRGRCSVPRAGRP
jgi:hypothetical protein